MRGYVLAWVPMVASSCRLLVTHPDASPGQQAVTTATAAGAADAVTAAAVVATAAPEHCACPQI